MYVDEADALGSWSHRHSTLSSTLASSRSYPSFSLVRLSRRCFPTPFPPVHSPGMLRRCMSSSPSSQWTICRFLHFRGSDSSATLSLQPRRSFLRCSSGAIEAITARLRARRQATVLRWATSENSPGPPRRLPCIGNAGPCVRRGHLQRQDFHCPRGPSRRAEQPAHPQASRRPRSSHASVSTLPLTLSQAPTAPGRDTWP